MHRHVAEVSAGENQLSFDDWFEPRNSVYLRLNYRILTSTFFKTPAIHPHNSSIYIIFPFFETIAKITPHMLAVMNAFAGTCQHWGKTSPKEVIDHFVMELFDVNLDEVDTKYCRELANIFWVALDKLIGFAFKQRKFANSGFGNFRFKHTKIMHHTPATIETLCMFSQGKKKNR